MPTKIIEALSGDMPYVPRTRFGQFLARLWRVLSGPGTDRSVIAVSGQMVIQARMLYLLTQVDQSSTSLDIGTQLTTNLAVMWGTLIPLQLGIVGMAVGAFLGFYGLLRHKPWVKIAAMIDATLFFSYTGLHLCMVTPNHILGGGMLIWAYIVAAPAALGLTRDIARDMIATEHSINLAMKEGLMPDVSKAPIYSRPRIHSLVNGFLLDAARGHHGKH